MPLLTPPLLAAFATLAALVVIATCTDVTLPRVEPELTGGGHRRSFLGDLAASVRDAAWPGDGGAVSTDAGRQQLEADAAALGRAVANQSLTVTAVTSAVLRLAADAAANLAVSQPLASLDACLVWRRRPSTAAATAGARDGTYYLTVFHSSVWSMLLLCLLCSVALLTLLESAHPIGMPQSLVAVRRRSRRHRLSASKPMGPFHALAFAAGALLLIGYTRGPKGTAGRVLALFWWLFAFAVAVAYLSATALTFLTTRSGQSDVTEAASVTLAEVLRHPAAGRVVLCSAGNPLCADWARPEPLALANFTSVATDSAGLEQLLLGSADLLLLTHQFACANLLAVDASHAYSLAIVAKATAWVSLAGPTNLVRQADYHIMNLLGSGQMARLEKQHGMASVGTYDGNCGDIGGVGKWLAELRLGLPYRIGSMYGPLILLIVGICCSLCTAACEFCYYRFYVDADEMQLEEEELEQKERALTIASTMDTYL